MNEGWVVGEEGTILHTTNSGQTWIAQSSGVTHRLRRLYFLDSQTGWVVGDSGAILYTTDRGQTWMPQVSGTAFRLYDITFTDENTGWVVGDNGTILRTTDGGVTWTRQPSGTINALLGIDFIDAQTGWISGEGGTILRFTGSRTGIAIEDEPDERPAAFVLAQNYPNPFNPQTTIPFTVVQSDVVRLQVFDILGQLVATLADGPYPADHFTVTWQPDAVPGGVYLYRLQTDTHAEMRKMLLMR
jgi:photosystem II stability/assembly factor-like uncharacterized protein